MGVCQLRHLSGREFKYQFRFHKVLFRIYTNYTDITEIKPELTSEEKRIVDVQIEVAMNTETNVDDLVHYLNKMAKIKHEVTRDLVIKRAKRMHIKLGSI